MFTFNERKRGRAVSLSERRGEAQGQRRTECVRTGFLACLFMCLFLKHWLPACCKPGTTLKARDTARDKTHSLPSGLMTKMQDGNV